MALFRVLTQKWSVTNGPGCLSWCFGTHQNKDPSDKTIDTKNAKDYGTTSKEENDNPDGPNGNTCNNTISILLLLSIS